MESRRVVTLYWHYYADIEIFRGVGTRNTFRNDGRILNRNLRASGPWEIVLCDTETVTTSVYVDYGLSETKQGR